MSKMTDDIVANVVHALKSRLNTKIKERNEVHDQVTGLLEREKHLDTEKKDLQTSIDYLNNHCLKTLVVIDVEGRMKNV